VKRRKKMRGVKEAKEGSEEREGGSEKGMKEWKE